MFLIKIHDTHNAYTKKNLSVPRYSVRYEQLPQLVGNGQSKIHEAQFTCLKTANSFCNKLSELLSDTFMNADLVFHKLNSLDYSYSFKADGLDYHTSLKNVQNTRFAIINAMKSYSFAYEHIARIRNFINALKMHCLFITDFHYFNADKLFQYLDKLSDHFIYTYRSAQMLYEEGKLNFFTVGGRP